MALKSFCQFPMILYYIGAFIFAGGVIFTNGLRTFSFTKDKSDTIKRSGNKFKRFLGR